MKGNKRMAEELRGKNRMIEELRGNNRMTEELRGKNRMAEELRGVRRRPGQNRVTWKPLSSTAFVPLQEPVGVHKLYFA